MGRILYYKGVIKKLLNHHIQHI